MGNYHFESNSQRLDGNDFISNAVISMGNYHFESNSQHLPFAIVAVIGCDFHGKLPF